MFIRKSIQTVVLLLLIVCSSATVHSQVKFYTDVSEEIIGTGQKFQLQFIVEGASAPPTFTIPALKQFVIHDSFENKTSSVHSVGLKLVDVYSKVFVVSLPAPGKYTVPVAHAVVDGKVMRAKSISLVVRNRGVYALKGRESSAERVPSNSLSELMATDDPDERIRKNLFLRATTNKASCFAGETLLVVYKMYSRLNTDAEILKRPSLAGLSIVEMVDNYEKDAEIEEIDGVAYKVSLIRKVQAFPLQAGELKMDIAEIASTVHFKKFDIDPLTGASVPKNVDYPVTLVTKPLSVTVKPLPLASQPENFSGAVGKFKLIVEALQKEIHPGDLVKIRVLIQGKGNIPLLIPPAIKWPRGVDTTEPAVRESFEKSNFPLEGYKSFEYSFSAPDTGSYIIPAAELVYFNPATQAYEKTTSDTVTMKVTPGGSTDREVVNQAIAESAKQKGPMQLYWFGVVVAGILFGIGYNIWAAKRKNTREIAKPIEVKAAVEPEPDRLEIAEVALSDQEMLWFYRELETALWKAAADAFDVLPSALNKKNIAATFQANSIDADVAKKFEEVLNECEWALYVPDHEMQNAAAALEKAKEIIERLVPSGKSL